MQEEKQQPVRLKVRNMRGESLEDVELDARVFGVPLKQGLLHQAIVMYQANRRQGNADTRGRVEVTGGGAKPYRQKGTGRARQGSIRAPQFRGGGVVFGPHPREYRQAMPKKMRRIAACSALSARAAEGNLIVLDELSFEAPNTKAMKLILEQLGITGKTLVVTPENEPGVYRSGRNIAHVRVIPAAEVNAEHVIMHRHLVAPVAALRNLEKRFTAEVKR
jgi:large subunit ribosomal protein L4